MFSQSMDNFGLILQPLITVYPRAQYLILFILFRLLLKSYCYTINKNVNIYADETLLYFSLNHMENMIKYTKIMFEITFVNCHKLIVQKCCFNMTLLFWSWLIYISIPLIWCVIL